MMIKTCGKCGTTIHDPGPCPRCDKPRKEKKMAEEPYPILDKLLCERGWKPWSLWAPPTVRTKAIKELRAEIAEEHQRACDDDEVSGLDTGVLLGALSLLDGLLLKKKKAKK